MHKHLKVINVYELIGIIIGDGSIWNYPNHRIYGLEITGNATEDSDFFRRIASFIFELTGKQPSVRIKYEPKGKSLKLVIYSKKFMNYLKEDLGLPSGNKIYSVTISEKYLDWEYSKHIIRGIFEADGSLYFSKINGIIKYPRLEIKTSSHCLAGQLVDILKRNHFKPCVRTSKSDNAIAVYLSGSESLDKWSEEIGFGNIKNYSKYAFWKKYGYYIPKSTTAERLMFLRG
jgi:DNA-binding transcriptional regulator WhiA